MREVIRRVSTLAAISCLLFAPSFSVAQTVNATGASAGEVAAQVDEAKSAQGGAKAGAADAKPDELTGTRESTTEAIPAAPLNGGEQVYERLMKSTAWIAAVKPDSPSYQMGTGWVVDRDRRLIVTNQHVVYDESAHGLFPDAYFRVFFPEYEDDELLTDRNDRMARGRHYKARLIEVDTPRDLAVLELDEIPDDILALPLAKSGSKPGQTVHSLGNPGSSEALWVYSVGNVRQVYRAKEHFPDADYDYLRVETQSPTNPGDSGGPVVNDRGELVAVNHGSHTQARLMTRFIDVSEVRAVLENVDKLLSAETAEELNARGDHYYAGGRYDLAIADFTAANQLDPKFAKALGNRGWTWMQKGDLVTALADFDEAIKLDARDPEFYQGRAKVHIADQNYEKALSDCVEAIRLDPQQAHSYNQRGDVFFYLAKYEQAIPDYSEAIRLKGDIAEYYNNRGASLSRLGKNEEAIADYSEAIRLNANEPQYLYNRATAYEKVNNPIAMAMDFVQLEQAFPEFAKAQAAHYNRRTLKVVNATKDRLQFWLKYHAWNTDNAWQWFPAEPGESNWTVYWLDPGEETYLEHNGVRVNADRIRFWAGNATTTKDWEKSTVQWKQYEETDLPLLPEEGEDGYFMRTYELRLE